MTLKNSFGKCSLFILSANENIETWTLRFPARENPNIQKALFDWPIVQQFDVKAKYRVDFQKVLGHELFLPQRHTRLYPFDKPIKSLYFRSFVVSVLFARFYFKVIRHTKIALQTSNFGDFAKHNARIQQTKLILNLLKRRMKMMIMTRIINSRPLPPATPAITVLVLNDNPSTISSNYSGNDQQKCKQ